jgi:3-hydroxybutyryl-CoA dehydrogenase
VLKFVEVIRTVVTEDAVVEDVKALAERLGKMPVVIGDKAGFIANALLFGYLNHAVDMFESRYATREDIDAAMQLGCGLPMGPLALMDPHRPRHGLRDPGHDVQAGTRPAARAEPILKQMVTGGLKGRKTGRGFYTYDEAGSSTVVPDTSHRPPRRPRGRPRR